MNNKKKIAFLAITILGIGLAAAVLTTDTADIGSDTTHTLSGWGLPEPDTNGGYWGDLANDPASADKKCAVTWAGTEVDTNDGRSAYITLDNPQDTKQVCSYKYKLKDGCSYYCNYLWNKYSHFGWSLQKFCTSYRDCCTAERVCTEVPVEKAATTLTLRVLDGQADDNFMVFAKCGDTQTLIFEYNADNDHTSEVWKLHSIGLSSLPSSCRSNPMTFRIMATGDSWDKGAYGRTKGGNTNQGYGQLAIDYAKLE